MRLLFIYFYREFASFKKDTIIHLSKKYKFVLDEEKSTQDEFYFNKKINLNFIEDFYSKNIDIGILIGENGTGKSVLLNSLRDKDNDYSICIYEEDDKFYILENDLFKIKKYKEFDKNNIPYEEKSAFLVKIDNIKLECKRKLKSIYYSSILEQFHKNLNDDYDISNIKLLNDIEESSLDKKIKFLEINDLYKMHKFGYPVKVDISETFFKDAKNFIKNSYMKLFEKTMELLYKNKKDEQVEKIFNFLPKFILDDIVEYHFENNGLFLEKIVHDNTVVNEYIDLYKKDIYNFLEKHEVNVNDELLKMDKQILENEDKLYSDDFFEELAQINFDIKITNAKDIIENIRKLFKIKYTPYKTTNLEENINTMLNYFYKEKLFDKCLIKLKSKKIRIDKIKDAFDIYKLYYLRQELGYKDFILTDSFKKGQFKDILLLDKKYRHLHVSKENEEIIYKKKETVNAIKQIIEDNYALFYDTVITDLENLDDEIVKLLILKQIEDFKVSDMFKDDRIKYLYPYLARFLKSESIENNEKDFLTKKYKEGKEVAFDMLVAYRKGKTLSNVNSKIDVVEYHEFVKDTIHPFSFTFSPPISSGQKAKEIINARINDAIQKINIENQNENILIILDEADLKLHLEWQRVLLHALIEFLIESYSNNKFYILYATHSPMVLSDITNDRVVFLKKEDNSNFSEDKQDFTKSTFGANIYDIYADSFFIDDFMGEFAQKKITHIIELIDSHKTNKQTASKEEAKNLSKIVKHIGEPLLRNKLEDEIKSLFEMKDDIEEIVETLKNKNFEEIKKELDKYTQDKQKQILEKLFGNQND